VVSAALTPRDPDLPAYDQTSSAPLTTAVVKEPSAQGNKKNFTVVGPPLKCGQREIGMPEGMLFETHCGSR